MADKFPSATVIGVDISPMQPSWVPPNLTFQIDDVQLDWTFKPESFDFIHVRFMYGAIDDLSKLYRQIYDHLKPGGWFQHLEPDILLRSDNPEVVVDKDQYVLGVLAQAATSPHANISPPASSRNGPNSSMMPATSWAALSSLTMAA